MHIYVFEIMSIWNNVYIVEIIYKDNICTEAHLQDYVLVVLYSNPYTYKQPALSDVRLLLTAKIYICVFIY